MDAARDDDRDARDDDRDDVQLLAAHVAGDPDAFGVLVTRHRDRLWAVALRTAGDPDLAADALQDGLVAAFRRAASFRGDAAVTTWLHRIVVNATLDLHRRRAVRAAVPLDETGVRHRDRADAGSAADARTDSRTDPEARVLAAERRRTVLDALARLPLEQRAALVLVDMEGWSIAEAATVLDCRPGTVKSRCARGRRRLAVLLEGTVAAPPASDGHRQSTASEERTVPRET